MNIITQLQKNGVSKYRIAKTLNVHWATVHRWSREVHQPKEANIQKLQELLTESKLYPKKRVHAG